MCYAKLQFRIVKMDWWESSIVFIIYSGKYLDNLNNIPADLYIFRAITSTRCLNEWCLSKIILKNLILLVASIVADPILILVKCNSFLYEIILYLFRQWWHCIDGIAVMALQWWHYSDGIAVMALQWWHCSDGIAVMALQWWHCSDGIAGLSLRWWHCSDDIAVMALQWCHCSDGIAVNLTTI